MNKGRDDEFDKKEAVRRFEAALKGALKTPHKPLKPAKATVKKSEPQKGNRK